MDTAVVHDSGFAAKSGLKQPYHLVEPSPWPIIGALGGGMLLTGIVFAAHWGNYLVLGGGLAITALVMFNWWRQVLVESGTAGVHSPVVRLGLRYGMMLFITSEVMFFVGFFWAFFHFALYPEHVLGVANPTWPPPGIHTFDAFRVPFLNTMILLLSGCTVTWAHHALLEGDRRSLILGLGISVLLGLSFTCLQAMEYSEAPFHFSGGGIYPSVFFLATGFHGFHVIVGTTFLAVCWFRANAGAFSPERHFGFEAAAWYWHFVDVVWLFLFIFIYIWAPARQCSSRMAESAVSVATATLTCRCPRCGRGHLFAGVLAIAPACSACGLDYSGFDTGDGFAVPILMVLGFIVAGGAIWLDMTYRPPLWVHAVVWIPVTTGLAVLMTRYLKSFFAAQQFHVRSTEMGL